MKQELKLLVVLITICFLSSTTMDTLKELCWPGCLWNCTWLSPWVCPSPAVSVPSSLSQPAAFVLAGASRIGKNNLEPADFVKVQGCVCQCWDWVLIFHPPVFSIGSSIPLLQWTWKTLLCQKGKKCSKANGDMSKEHKNQPEEAPSSKIWNNLNIKINNPGMDCNPLNK